MQMNRMSDVGKLISDFVNSWHSTSKDYGLKKCTSYLTISLPQDARAGVQMIWDLCLEIEYNSRQWTVSKSALRQKKQVNQWSGRQRHRWSTAGSSNSTNSRKSDWLHAGKYFSPVSGKYSQQYHGKYYCCPLILYVLQIYTYDRPQIWSADKYLGRSHEITKSSNQEIMKC